MRLFSRSKPFKKEKADKEKRKADNKSSKLSSIVNQTKNSGSQSQSNQTSDNNASVIPQVVPQITITCPEKKERIFSVSNVIATAALIISASAVYFAAQSNMQIARQFDIENRPFVILKTAHADTIKEPFIIWDTLTIKNVGKTPAYFMSARFDHSFDTVFNPSDLVYTDTIKFEVNRFIESGSTFTFIFGTKLVNPKFFDYIKREITFLHNFGEVVYKDIISGKKYLYKFSVRVLPNGQTQPTHIGDRVTEIKD